MQVTFKAVSVRLTGENEVYLVYALWKVTISLSSEADQYEERTCCVAVVTLHERTYLLGYCSTVYSYNGRDRNSHRSTLNIACILLHTSTLGS